MPQQAFALVDADERGEGKNSARFAVWYDHRTDQVKDKRHARFVRVTREGSCG